MIKKKDKETVHSSKLLRISSSSHFSYGDRCPKGVLAKVFAIVWFLIGLIIFTFFGSAVAAMMTVTVITGGPTLKQTTNKVCSGVMATVIPNQWP